MALSWLTSAQSLKLTYNKTATINGKEITAPFNYILESNDSIAIFYPENEDNSSYFKLPQEQGLVVFKDFGDSPIFYKKGDNAYTVEQVFNPSNGEKLTLINAPLPRWKITNETKQIGEFLCYKAIAIGDERLYNKEETIVWFTPTPIINAGPAQFCNLPGMVVIIEGNKINAGYKLIKVENSSKISHQTTLKAGLEKIESLYFFKAIENIMKESQKK